MRPKTAREGVTDEDVQRVWEEFWIPTLFENPEEGRRVQQGILEVKLEQIKKELYDYWVLLEEVPKVYETVTGGRISKPNTCSGAVIAEFEDYLTRTADEDVKERTEDLLSERNQAIKDLEHLKGNLAECERIRQQNVRLKRAARMALERCAFPEELTFVKTALAEAIE